MIGTHVRLPAVGFISQAEYDAWCDHAAPLIAAQARLDAAALAAPEPQASMVRHVATCAPCLRPATLAVEIGSRAGLRRGAQSCDCEDALGLAARMLLHAAAAEGGLQPWSRLLLFGPPAAGHGRLRRLAADPVSLSGFGAAGRLAAADGGFHLILAPGSLGLIADLARGLTELRRVAAPGGVLLATLALRPRARTSGSQPARAEHLHAGMVPRATEFGWDILPMLRAAGFAHAMLLRVWSQELGYWGSNFLLKATA